MYQFPKSFPEMGNGGERTIPLEQDSWKRQDFPGLLCLAKSVMMKYDLQMRFVTAPDYISAVGDSYKCDRGEEDPSQVYRDCKLLVLDDIGAQADKEWQRQEMFRLINKRMEDGNITIYTSNMNTDNLNVDTRTRDRIVKTCVELQMPEEGIRKKKAAGEQRQFLASVMG